MPIASTRAFVLGSAELKEQDKTVHLLTLDRGILKAIAPGALKNRNRFGALLELFTEGEFQYYWKEDKEFITLSKGDLVKSYFTVVSEPRNIFYFYMAAEVLLRFVPYEHKDPRIFRLVKAFLEGRGNGAEMHLLLLYFLVWILRIEGMMFKPDRCSNCHGRGLRRAWMRTDFRGILCGQCRSDESVLLSAGDLDFIDWTEKHAPGEVNTWKDKLDAAPLIRTIKRKLEYHGEFQLKTSHYLPEFS